MGEKYFVERQSCRTVNSKGTRCLWLGALSWQNCWVSTISKALDRHNWVVHAVSRISWIGRWWWRARRVRVENFPRTHNTAATSGNPKNDGGKEKSAWTIPRSNHLHVDVQRHWLGKRRKQKSLYGILQTSLHTPEDFPRDIGHSSDRDRKKNDTERTFTNQTVRGTVLLVCWWWISERADILYPEENKCVVLSSLKRQRRWNNIDTL